MYEGIKYVSPILTAVIYSKPCLHCWCWTCWAMFAKPLAV